MHYRNGREAKNGDVIVQFGSADGKAAAVGVLANAQPGNDYCNGQLIPLGTVGSRVTIQGACLCDCIHADDLAALLTEKGLDKRPAGK